MRISFIIPSRNNLKYLQQAVKSIETHYGTNHDIVLLDDASTDGTWEWISSLTQENIIKYKNEGPERLGHTILYDKGVELSNTDIFSILHADMIVTPNYVSNIVKHLSEKKVVCATRIEPPLHPPGPEKFVKSYGFEPEEFKQEELLQFVKDQEKSDNNKVSNGIFAPWCMYKKDFQSIQGHDKLFAPMELEDSDIFNRMKLAGYELLQSRDSFVYHMTCRGSRFKDGIEIESEIPMPDGTIWYKPKDSEEYKKLREIKFREWWRKWGCDVLHDELMNPIIPHKYDIAFYIQDCSYNILEILEPWCSKIFIDNPALITDYIKSEQPKTLFNLKNKVNSNKNTIDNDIVIEFDAKKMNIDNYKLLTQMSNIITSSGEVGEFELGIFKITIKSMETYEHKFIVNNDTYYTKQLI
jgi:glycosyltransferase involved in cell wall biosynthesis